MGQILKEAWENNIWLKILTISAILLFFIGLFLPPIGVIDNSVIIAVSELMGFGALWELNKSIENGLSTKVKIKQIELEIAKSKEGKEDEENSENE